MGYLRLLHLSIIVFLLSVFFVLAKLYIPGSSANAASEHRASNSIDLPTWTHLSSANGDLPLPSTSHRQSVALIADIDGDNVNDFVIASQRAAGSAVVWYQRHNSGWQHHVIDDTVLNIEAGGATHDVDGDGDIDVILASDTRGNEIWWWENPHPNFTAGENWTRRLIKNSGAAKHHDIIFGDFDGDNRAEFVFWNQHGRRLFLAEIPANPKQTSPWPYSEIYAWQDETEHEGLAVADVDGDGVDDIVGGGRWFQHSGAGAYTTHLIDDSQRFTQAGAGQLVTGGRSEVVFSAGDLIGPLRWYEWKNNRWIGHDLLAGDIDHGHSLAVADMNNDGFLDIFAAEMNLNDSNPDAHVWIFYGDGSGNFTKQVVSSGIGGHESKVGDLDGDGDLDILGKPWTWDTPRVDVWLNDHIQNPCTGAPIPWQRHLIEDDKPWRSIFVTSADIDRDGHVDVITGGWWYKNPGTPGGTWTRRTIGTDLNNMATVADFDRDGDVDILGTGGEGSAANDTFVWARNDGAGNLTILENIAAADGTFLQGVAVIPQANNRDEVILSWHDGSVGLQAFTVPQNPSTQQWSWRTLTATGNGEGIDHGDIDRNGGIDLLLGTQWLRTYDASPPQQFTLYETSAEADRNILADINGDGRLDAVVGYEAVSRAGKLAWYAQGTTATALWTEHVIANPIGPMSLDVVDIDHDGDLDVVVGEHYPADSDAARMLLYENVNGQGTVWQEHLVHQGDEHHVGAHTVDIDGDGDRDIVSIGWTSDDVVLYENQDPCKPEPTPTPTATSTPTPQPTSTGTATAVPTPTATSTPVPQPTSTGTVSATPTPTATSEPSTPPVIVRQPTAHTVAVNESVQFTVEVQGSEPLSYQWQHNGKNIPGATAPTYRIPNVTASDDGALFRCIILNEAGHVISQNALLTVIRPNSPPMARFTHAPTTGDVPLTVTFDASTSSDSDGSLVSYAWVFGDGTTGQGVVVEHTYRVSGFFTATLTITDDDGATATKMLQLQVGAAAGAPEITTHPESVEARIGERITFTVAAAGTELTYQWLRDGIPIPNATAPTYVLPIVHESDNGVRFSCIVSSPTGQAASDPALVSVPLGQGKEEHLLYLPLIRQQ